MLRGTREFRKTGLRPLIDVVEIYDVGRSPQNDIVASYLACCTTSASAVARVRLSRHLRVAPRKSKLRYSAIDDQFRSGHEGGIVAREEQDCLGDLSGLAET